MGHSNAERLYALCKNRGLLKRSLYYISNHCPEYAK